jgi:hypothetical protein
MSRSVLAVINIPHSLDRFIGIIKNLA